MNHFCMLLGSERQSWSLLPSLLPREPLVEQCEYFRHVELDIFEIKVVLVVLLHLKQIVKLEVKLQEATVAS